MFVDPDRLSITRISNTHRDLLLGLEPDLEMYRSLCEQQAADQLLAYCEFRHATVESLDKRETFNAAVYIDVLEHIEDDAAEVNRVAQHIDQGGYLIVLSPAYQFLFSEFDKNIGHFCRYNREMIKVLTPSNKKGTLKSTSVPLLSPSSL